MTGTEALAAGGRTFTETGGFSDGRSPVSDRSTGDPLNENGAVPVGAPSAGIPADAIRHGCGRWWTGTRVAHCGGCCRHFSSTTAFDQHQRGGKPGALCRDPAEVGLVPVTKPYGVLWSWPGDGRNPHGSRGSE